MTSTTSLAARTAPLSLKTCSNTHPLLNVSVLNQHILPYVSDLLIDILPLRLVSATFEDAIANFSAEMWQNIFTRIVRYDRYMMMASDRPTGGLSLSGLVLGRGGGRGGRGGGVGTTTHLLRATKSTTQSQQDRTAGDDDNEVENDEFDEDDPYIHTVPLAPTALEQKSDEHASFDILSPDNSLRACPLSGKSSGGPLARILLEGDTKCFWLLRAFLERAGMNVECINCSVRAQVFKRNGVLGGPVAGLFGGGLGHRHQFVRYAQELHVSPLVAAMYSGNTDLVEYLLTKTRCYRGPAVETGFSPLHIAVRDCNVDIVRTLLNYNNNNNNNNNNKCGCSANPPLRVVAEENPHRLSKQDGTSIIQQAPGMFFGGGRGGGGGGGGGRGRGGGRGIARGGGGGLFGAGPPPPTTTASITTQPADELEQQYNIVAPPIHIATSLSKLEVLQELLNHGASANAPDPSMHGQTPIFRAKDPAVLDLLLQYGADVNYRDTNWGLTPLHQAILDDMPEKILRLVEVGADKEATTTKNGMTPLIGAASDGQSQSLQALVHAGCDLNRTIPFSTENPVEQIHLQSLLGHPLSALAVAVIKGKTDVIDILLQAGANPEYELRKGGGGEGRGGRNGGDGGDDDDDGDEAVVTKVREPVTNLARLMKNEDVIKHLTTKHGMAPPTIALNVPQFHDDTTSSGFGWGEGFGTTVGFDAPVRFDQIGSKNNTASLFALSPQQQFGSASVPAFGAASRTAPASSSSSAAGGFGFGTSTSTATTPSLMPLAQAQWLSK